MATSSETDVLKRWISAVLIAVVAVFSVSSVANAQYPPVKKPTLVISRDIGPPGYTFTATVTNCVPGQRIVFVLGDQRVDATCDPVTMQATVTLTAPPGLGSYTVSAEFYGDCTPFGLPPSQPDVPCLVLSETIQVIDAATTTTTVAGGNIPTTGSSGVNSTLSTALVLVLTGLGVFVVSRIRRRPAVS